jgi:hypothetical protein
VHASEFLEVPIRPNGVGQYTKVFVLSEKKEGQITDAGTAFGGSCKPRFFRDNFAGTNL